MKKRNRIFVCILMFCFLVTGCTTSGAGANEGGTAAKTPSSVMVRIEINPQFTLGLDENNTIVDVLFENLDAKLLFEELEVLNMSYSEGMSLILNKAYEMKYIKSDSSEIKMEIMFVGDKNETQEEEVTEVLKQPMETFFAEKELAIEINVPEVAEGIEAKTDTSWSGVTTETYFENNKKIKSIEYADNSYICKEYNEKGSVVREIRITGDTNYSCKEFDDKGNLKKSIWRDRESGSYVEDYYNENRKVTKQIIINLAAGSRGENLFWENGNIKSQICTREDGYYSECYYDEDGKIKYDVWVLQDGSRQVTYYDANGNIEKMIWYNADGTCDELHYDGNGNMILVE